MSLGDAMDWSLEDKLVDATLDDAALVRRLATLPRPLQNIFLPYPFL